MNSTEESVIFSLDGEGFEIYPYLDYILQDCLEIGSSPEVIYQLLRRNSMTRDNKTFKVADLGCGKGSVSVKLAVEFDCQVTGLDAYPPFIRDAEKYAANMNVSRKCEFEIADIRKKINELKGFDLAILGSIGPILGNTGETLEKLRPCLNPDGFIVLDEAYIIEETGFKSDIYQTRQILVDQIEKQGYEIVDEILFTSEEMRTSNEDIFNNIKKRTDELIEKHPDKRAIFEQYVESQSTENDVLENKVTCVTWLLKAK